MARKVVKKETRKEEEMMTDNKLRLRTIGRLSIII